MNKKLMGLAAAVGVTAAAVGGAIIWQSFNGHPAYGKYVAEDVNGAPSYVMLDENSITFNNVDFSSAALLQAQINILEQQRNENSSEAEPEHGHESENGHADDCSCDECTEDDAEAFKKKHEAFMAQAETLAEELNFSSAFNGKTFELSTAEEDADSYSYEILDTDTDYFVMVYINKVDQSMSIQKTVLKYEG